MCLQTIVTVHLAAMRRCWGCQGTRVTYGETEGSQDTWDADRIRGCQCDGTPHYSRITTVNDTGYFVDPQCTLRECRCRDPTVPAAHETPACCV
jgi:hypothetical protein